MWQKLALPMIRREIIRPAMETICGAVSSPSTGSTKLSMICLLEWVLSNLVISNGLLPSACNFASLSRRICKISFRSCSTTGVCTFCSLISLLQKRPVQGGVTKDFGRGKTSPTKHKCSICSHKTFNPCKAPFVWAQVCFLFCGVIF